MNWKSLMAFALLAMLHTQCDKNDPEPIDGNGMMTMDEGLSFNTGKNQYTEFLGESDRSFIVHVPIIYDRFEETPVVYAFHDVDETAESFYNSSGWVEKSNQENFIVVFPQARSYPVVELGRTAPIWTEFDIDAKLEPGTAFINDEDFIFQLDQVIALSFNVDSDRIYATGMGQGGDFVKSKILIDLDNVIASVATVGSIGIRELLVPANNQFRSALVVMGTDDEVEWMAAGSAGPFELSENLPFQFDYLDEWLSNLLITLKLSPMGTVSLDAGILKLNYTNSIANQSNELEVRIIQDLPRLYPNGENNTLGLNIVDSFWDFFQNHPK